jgi:hypothetical protein
VYGVKPAVSLIAHTVKPPLMMSLRSVCAGGGAIHALGVPGENANGMIDNLGQAAAHRARSSGSVVTWLRAQMVLQSATGMDASEVAEVALASADRVRDVLPTLTVVC